VGLDCLGDVARATTGSPLVEYVTYQRFVRSEADSRSEVEDADSLRLRRCPVAVASHVKHDVRGWDLGWHMAKRGARSP
jgi:hypothetical protein